MRLLANENIPADVVDALRTAGHDVAWVRADSPGITDDEVLVRSVAEARLLITFDKDFGELVFRRGRVASAGVVLFRLPGMGPALLAQRVLAALNTRTDWPGQFSVVESKRVRMLPLPGSPPSP